MTNQCEGCHTYDGKECMNGLPRERNGWECPCRTCLVKMVCTKQCEDMYRYDFYINNQKYTENVLGAFL